ncbi:cytoplasmic phosphatidylinositol transfer protein 1-like [Tyto alba]|uniref:cytoplasmic phosphatidylinositol transfer protein 1-like n=1 Tax=Tyto alba TaxID=56313 RepID=UPI001C67842D|nr:cytoplasmic phosphatidylinositol transfer protein 1-like [Tyto alba]
MTMEEVRRYERETQEATNELIGLVAPTISVSEVGQPTATHSAPASAPSTPLSDEPPDFLAPPKTRPRKKSAPETLTLPALRERAGAE